jgi:protein phosphatase
VPNILDRLFPKKSSYKDKQSIADIESESYHSDDIKKIVLNSDRDAHASFETFGQSDTSQLLVGIAQSIGIHRDANEDSLFALTSNLISNGQKNNFGLFIIADGMGGHENGEVASSIAINELSFHVIEHFYLPTISKNKNKLDLSIQEVLLVGVKNAHHAIKKAASGSGTTVTAALIFGDQLTLVHVGDSRAYIIDPDWQMKVLTHDHSLVKRLEEIGQITTDEAATHPKRNLLYRAVGQGDQLEPDIISLQTFPGQMLLLCSDGLWGVVPDAEILQQLHSSVEPHIASQLLVDAANAAGGPDNISVILVRFPV